jgi:hypothetical protein
MIEEFAVWLGCNPSLQDPALCAVNTLLIGPGVMGLFSVLILYVIAIPILAWMGIRYLVRYMSDKLGNK